MSCQYFLLAAFFVIIFLTQKIFLFFFNFNKTQAESRFQPLSNFCFKNNLKNFYFF